jgi:hypothetical protein
MSVRDRLLQADHYNFTHSVRDPLHLEAARRIQYLEQALEWALDSYVAVCDTNTSESWNAEEEQEVINARKLLALA